MSPTTPTPNPALPFGDDGESMSFSTEDLLSLADLSDIDFSALADFDSGVELAPLDADDLLAPSEELHAVARRISGQYVEVLAAFVSAAFAGRAEAAALTQAASSVNALHRLAKASQDHAQLSLLDQLTEMLPALTDERRNSRTRQAALTQLRDWVPAFAETLDPADGKRLRALVSWTEGAAPLLDELGNLHGIGPKRLEALYAAGLFTVRAVASADATEIAQVTGMPRKLAVAVVEATRSYAAQERRRCIEALRERAIRLRNVLEAHQTDTEPELVELAQEALREVETTFRQLGMEDRR